MSLVPSRSNWAPIQDTDEAALEALLFPAKAKPDRFVEPDYFQVHQELKRKGVTLQLLWAESRTATAASPGVRQKRSLRQKPSSILPR